MTHLRLRPCSEEMIYLEKTCTVNHVLWKMFKIQKSFFHGALNFWPIQALEKKKFDIHLSLHQPFSTK